MKLIFFLLFVHLMLSAYAQNSQPLVISNVSIIDCTGKPAQPGMTVIIENGRIRTITTVHKAKASPNAVVVDGTGKYLIPGLWDMHVHGTPLPGFSELYVANGVTGVRDMYWFPSELKKLRESLESGKRVGPRILSAGRIVDGPKPFWPGSVAVSNAEEGRKAVQTVKSEGSDFVKVYSLLPREGYFAIVAEAKKQRIPFAGHVPDSISSAEASDAGQKSIEHLTGVLMDCSTKVNELRQARIEALSQSEAALFRLWGMQAQTILDTYSEEKANMLFKKFAANKTWHCPTLIVMLNITRLDDEKLKDDPRTQYMPIFIKSMWDPKNDARFRNASPERYAMMRKTHAMERSLIVKMRKAGVEFLAGTDAINPYCYPGFSLHEELALLVNAGLTPMEALQAATRNPARFLELEKTLGTVERGKIADLVLLNANPLENIQNTTQIQAVIQNGKLYDRKQLDDLLEKAKKSAATLIGELPLEGLHAGSCCH
jgi:imidazolonepropionase-like amidohydrolase